jgi:hypothetical protein
MGSTLNRIPTAHIFLEDSTFAAEICNAKARRLAWENAFVGNRIQKLVTEIQRVDSCKLKQQLSIIAGSRCNVRLNPRRHQNV